MNRTPAGISTSKIVGLLIVDPYSTVVEVGVTGIIFEFELNVIVYSLSAEAYSAVNLISFVIIVGTSPDQIFPSSSNQCVKV
jgi:hypothetical protein